jgi:hypothetical protein
MRSLFAKLRRATTSLFVRQLAVAFAIAAFLVLGRAVLDCRAGRAGAAVKLLDCRAGRAGAAVKLLDDRWMDCENALDGTWLRPLRVVRAFAIAAAGPREGGVAEAVLAPAKPLAFRGEYAFLGAAWPEMAAFLAAHELG